MEERQDTDASIYADQHLAFRVDAVHLKDRLGDVESDGFDRLQVWLLRIVGELTARTSLADATVRAIVTEVHGRGKAEKMAGRKAEMLDLLRQIAADLRWLRIRAERQDYEHDRASEELEKRKQEARTLAQESLRRSTE